MSKKHPIKNRSDKRYIKIEKRIYQAIDEMIASGNIKTQTMDFSKYAGINSCTFYRHYPSVLNAITRREQAFFDGLKRCVGSKNLAIVYYQIFLHFSNNQLYFVNAKSHLNTDLIESFAMNDLKPIIYHHWRTCNEYPIIDNGFNSKIYHMHCHELLHEYHKWAICENFSKRAINGHVRHLLYLTSTAHYRFGHVAR